jgi:hypothetical protein
MKKFLIFFFLPLSLIFADSITLYNDSAYELIAIVKGANGVVLAQKTLAPGEQSVWTTDQMSTQLDVEYDYTSSYTPYTVIWQCSYENIFSVCYNVAAGAIVQATSCSGPHYCKPKPQKKQEDQNNQETQKLPKVKTNNKNKTSFIEKSDENKFFKIIGGDLILYHVFLTEGFFYEAVE